MHFIMVKEKASDDHGITLGAKPKPESIARGLGARGIHHFITHVCTLIEQNTSCGTKSDSTYQKVCPVLFDIRCPIL